MAAGDGIHYFKQRSVVSHGIFLKTREVLAEIIVGKRCVCGHRSGQETLAERAERHKADAQFTQYGKNRRFRLAPPQRILTLQGGNGLHRVGTADGVRARFGQAEIAHLAGGNQLFHRTCHLFHRHGGIDAVLVQQVDVVGIHAGKRLLNYGTDAFGAAVQAVGDDAVFETEFGGDDDFLAKRRHRLAEQALVRFAVGFGGIEKLYAQLKSAADQGDAIRFGDGLAIAVSHAHAAEAEGGNRETLHAEGSGLHKKFPVVER